MRKIAILGGSSAFTPALVAALAHAAAALPPLRLTLFGRNVENLDAVVRFSNLHAEHREAEHRYDASTDLDAALADADIVVNQIRVGGFAGRSHDETFPLEFGLPGDETIGPGGLASAIRSVPCFIAIGERIRQLAPHAPLVQMSNPLGVGLAALGRISGLASFGLCELPERTLHRACALIGIDPVRVTADYVGANHQGWFVAVRDTEGTDRLPDILDALAGLDEPGPFGVDGRRAAALGALPLPYLRLYEHTAQVVARSRARAVDRGVELAELARDLFAHYATTADPALPDELRRRETPWNELALVPALQSLFDGRPRRLAVSVRNDSFLPSLPADAILERFGDQVPLAGRTQAPRLEPGAKSTPHILRFLERLSRFERCAVDTALDPTEAGVAECLALHPLEIAPEVARALAPHVLRRIDTDATPEVPR